VKQWRACSWFANASDLLNEACFKVSDIVIAEANEKHQEKNYYQKYIFLKDSESELRKNQIQRNRHPSEISEKSKFSKDLPTTSFLLSNEN
jgi:hypothetical protein